MNEFDRAMNHLDKAFGFSGAQHQYVSRKVRMPHLHRVVWSTGYCSVAMRCAGLTSLLLFIWQHMHC